MSERHVKRQRREVHKYLRDAGITPEKIRESWRATVKPKPRWLPGFVWMLLVRIVVSPPKEPGVVPIA